MADFKGIFKMIFRFVVIPEKNIILRKKNRNLILFKICNKCFIVQNENVRSKIYNSFGTSFSFSNACIKYKS